MMMFEVPITVTLSRLHFRSIAIAAPPGNRVIPSSNQSNAFNNLKFSLKLFVKYWKMRSNLHRLRLS